jgi:hypothetical protein
MAAAISTAMTKGRFNSPKPAKAPTTNNNESPGKKGITTKPVSTNTIRKSNT